MAAAFVMRGPVTGIGPIAEEITKAYGISWPVYGLLSALPVAAFGLCSFLMPPLSERLGLERASLAALLVLAAGCVLRLTDSIALLFLGTFLVGTGIALLNAGMPAAIRSRWPARMGSLMGIYAGMIGFSGAAGGLLAAPLFAAGKTLRWPFGFWAIAAGLAAAAWGAMIVGKRKSGRARAEGKALAGAASENAGPAKGLLELMRTEPLLWVLTAVMGLQSLLIYTAAAWMPAYWRAQGMPADETGIWIFVFLFSGLPASMLTARFFDFVRSDALAGMFLSLLYLAGLAGWLAGGMWMPAASAAAGAAQGAMLSAAFLLMGKHTRGTRMMLAVSAFSQGVGYLGAGCGPWIFGLLHDAAQDWTLSFVFFAAVTVLWAAAVRMAAGRKPI